MIDPDDASRVLTLSGVVDFLTTPDRLSRAVDLLGSPRVQAPVVDRPGPATDVDRETG